MFLSCEELGEDEEEDKDEDEDEEEEEEEEEEEIFPLTLLTML